MSAQDRRSIAGDRFDSGRLRQGSLDHSLTQAAEWSGLATAGRASTGAGDQAVAGGALASDPDITFPSTGAAILAAPRWMIRRVRCRPSQGGSTPRQRRSADRLVRNVNRLMPHQALLDRVWGGDCGATEHYLRVFISRLRSKLEQAGGTRYIKTERGRGYRYVRPTER
jgi:hypothetical protein